MKSVFEQIKDRLPIAEVLASYITLVPSGNQFKAKCPFHSERTPSFYVSPDRGFYYCFGCGAKGDIFTFIQQFEGLDTKGALRVLAERAHVSLIHNQQSDQKRDHDDELYSIHQKVCALYQYTLAHHPEVNEYLKKRGLQTETIQEFQIGYAPAEWRYVASAIEQKELLVAEDAGLLKKTEKGYYDRFRGRIMFPLADSSGRIIAFSGRSFPDTETGPKYLNSPETALFHKSEILYGYDKAKFAIKKHNFAILVEGQMDLLMSHQAGFKNTVATSGTAVSEDTVENVRAQLHAVSRLTSNVILAFDGDDAGQNAMTRAALVVLALGMTAKVALLPNGTDPADYIKDNGADAWKTILKESVSFIEHQTKRILLNGASAHKLASELRISVFPFLMRVQSRIEQMYFVERVAELTGVSTKTITDEFETFQRMQKNSENLETASQEIKSLTAYERLIGIMQKLPMEDKTLLQSELALISFHEHAFSSPSLSIETVDQGALAVEREYRGYESVQLMQVAKELLEQIRRQFYKDLAVIFTQQLNIREKNKEDAQELLEQLRELNGYLKP